MGLIFDSTLTMQEGACKDSAAVTLMSTDIQSIITNLSNLNEVWASSIEVVIGIYLLARQMSYLAVIPLVVYGASTFFQGKITARVSSTLSTDREVRQALMISSSPEA